MYKYHILFTNQLNLIENWAGTEYHINSYIYDGTGSTSNEYYKKCSKLTCKNMADAITKICTTMHWKLLSVTDGIDKNGFNCHILIFEELDKNFN